MIVQLITILILPDEICGLIEEKTVKLMSVLDGVAKIIELKGCFDNVVTSDDSVFVDTLIVEYNPVVAIELEDDPVIL